MEDEIQKYIDSILDMDFFDDKIDLCFTAVYYYLHNHPNNNAIHIDERCKMKESLQYAIKKYPEISNITWDEFVAGKPEELVNMEGFDNKSMDASTTLASPTTASSPNATVLRTSALGSYNVFCTIFCKAFCTWRERNWFGMTDTMIKDANNIMYVFDCDLPHK
jgi:hypothetical protein